MQTTRTQRAAPYFQVLRKLLHVDFLHEDEVPEADIGVEGHGGVVSLSVSVNTEHCVWWREFCVTEAVSWVVEGLALCRWCHTAARQRSRVEQSRAVQCRAEQVSDTAQVTTS